MKHLTQTLLLIITLALFTGCEKEDPLAACKADPTCEYFRCKVDGKEWRPDCESAFLGCDAVDVQYYREIRNGTLTVLANNQNDSSGLRLINISINKENFDYALYWSEKSRSEYFIKSDGDWSFYLVDTLQHNLLNLSKIDTINTIIEGTFEFTGINESNEIKTVTNGEFRQQYRF